MRRQRILSDNPVARREWRSFIRHAYIWIPALLAIWIPMTWITRAFVREMAAGAVSPLASEIMHTLAMAFRPDIFIALLLIQRSAGRDKWHNARDEYAVTFLSPVQLLAGKAIVPITLLALFHLVGIGYYYAELIYDPGYVVSLTEGGPSYRVGIPILIFAFVEDLLFATVVVLIALRSYLFQPDALKATLGAITRLFLLALLIALCSWAWPLLLDIAPTQWLWWLLMDPGRFALMSNLVWFATVIPMEIILIVVLWWLVKRKLAVWLDPRRH